MEFEYDDLDGVKVSVTEFHYETKFENKAVDIPTELPEVGKLFVWIDIDVSDEDRAYQFLSSYKLDDMMLKQALLRRPSSIFYKEDHIGFSIPGCWLVNEEYRVENLNCIIGHRFFITIHWGENLLLSKLKKGYSTDLKNYARNPSFIAYELWYRLINNYLYIQERLQAKLRELDEKLNESEVNEETLRLAANLHSDYLGFRQIVIPSRTTLNYLATKGRMFISEAGKPFLSTMVETMERLMNDITTDRQILSDSVGFYVSFVSYKMNFLIKRLTAINVISLPLMFITSMYGMNFKSMPEFNWKYGYAWFWVLVLTVIFIAMNIIRRAKLF